MNSPSARSEALRAAEARRCECLVGGGFDELEQMLADDLVHVHLNGHVDDKAAYLAGVSVKYAFANVSRGPLNIRIWADTAVMVGPLAQRVTVRETGKEIDVRAITTQTWQFVAGRWLLTTCHNAPVI